MRVDVRFVVAHDRRTDSPVLALLDGRGRVARAPRRRTAATRVTSAGRSPVDPDTIVLAREAARPGG